MTVDEAIVESEANQQYLSSNQELYSQLNDENEKHD